MAEVSHEGEVSFWSVAERLQREGQLCDIQLCVPSAENPEKCDAIHAHKLVLIGASLFFQGALETGDLMDVYNFEGISQENLQLVVDYMYRRTTLEELLANTEASFAAQSIQLLNHEDDASLPRYNVKQQGRRPLELTDEADLTASRLDASIDNSTDLENQPLEGEAAGCETDGLNSGCLIKNEFCIEDEDDMAGCIQIMNKGSATPQKQLVSHLDSVNQKTFGSNDESSAENVQNIPSVSGNGSTLKGSEIIQIYSAKMEITENASTEVASENSFVNKPQQDCHVSSCSVDPNLAQVVNNSTILGISNDCSSKPLDFNSNFVKGPADEITGRSSQRRRKTLNYQLLADGADIPEDNSIQNPPSISVLDETPDVEPQVDDGSSVIMVEPDSSTPIIKLKRKRGRPRKNVASVIEPNILLEDPNNKNTDQNDSNAANIENINVIEADKVESCISNVENQSINPKPKEQVKSEDVLTESLVSALPSITSLKTSTSVDVENTKCRDCARVFKSKSALAQHRKIIHSVKLVYGCTKCGLEVESIRQLEKHKKDVHHISMYACVKCALQFKTREGLKIHDQKKHSGAKPNFKCDICEKAFFLRGELKTHVQFHSEERNYQCERCTRAFKSKSLLVRHVNTVHSNERKFQCDVCGTMFKTRNDCKAHRLKHFRTKDPIVAGGQHGGKRRPDQDGYPCQMCDKVFKKRSHQLVHENLQHRQKNDGTAYMCTVCSKVFPIRHYLMQHIKNCHSQRRFPCPSCSQLFAQRGDLKKHQLIAGRCKGMSLEPKPFTCPHCNKGFSLKGNLSRHLQRPKRCHGNPANPDVIVVLSSEATTEGIEVAVDMMGEHYQEPDGGLSPSEETVEQETTNIVSIDQCDASVDANKVELQGLVDGKLVPISMSHVDGQYQFSIADTDDQLDNMQVVYEVNNTHLDNNSTTNAALMEVEESGQEHLTIADDVNSHIIQHGEVVAEVVLQDDSSGQVIIGEDIDQDMASEDVNTKVMQLFEEGVLVNAEVEEQHLIGVEDGLTSGETQGHPQIEEVSEMVISMHEENVHIVENELILDSQDSVNLGQIQPKVGDQLIEVPEQMVQVTEEVSDQLVEVNQEVIQVVDDVVYLEQSQHVPIC